MKLASAARALTVAMAILLASACSTDPTRGYGFASSYDDRVRSISVNVFENNTFHPGLEAELAAALTKRVQTDTPWAVLGPNRAQTTLSGSITDVQIQRITQDVDGGITQQAGVRVIADFRWESTVTGRVLAERRGVAVMETFIPAAGEPIEVGLTAAVDELAGAILESMRSVW